MSDNQLAVLEPQVNQPEADAQVRSHETFLEVLDRAGAPYIPGKGLTYCLRKHYKETLKLSKADVDANIARVLKGNAPNIVAQLTAAIAAGWLPELKIYKGNKKTGEIDHFAIDVKAPKTVKITLEQQEAMARVFGKESDLFKALMQKFTDEGMLAKAPTRDVVAQPVQQTPEPATV